MAKEKSPYQQALEQFSVKEGTEEAKEFLRTFQNISVEYSKLKKLNEQVADKLKLQTNIQRELELAARKDTEQRRKQRDILFEIRSAAGELMILKNEELNAFKTELPYAKQIRDIEAQIMDIKKFGLSGSQQSELRDTLEMSLKQLRVIQTETMVLQKRKEIQERTLEVFGLSLDKVKEIGQSVDSFIKSPWLAIIALLGLAVKLWTDIQGSTSDFRKEMGLARDTSVELEKSARDVWQTNMGIGASYEDSLAAASELVKVAGNTAVFNKQNLDLMVNMNKNWGISNEASAQFLTTLQRIGLSQRQIQESTNQVLSLAEQYGISASGLISDISESIDDGYSFLSRYPDAFVKTAAKARALGMSMKNVLDIAKGLLDFESSISDEMEAVVMSGKNINLNQARWYALMGDSEKMLNEVLKQLGSAEEFNKMLPLQQESFAKALGMSAAELGKTLQMEEAIRAVKNNNATDAQKDLVRQQQIQTNLDQMMNSWKTIATTVSSIFLPAIEAVMPIFEFVSSITQGISNTIKKLPEWVRSLIPILALAGIAAYKAFKPLMGMNLFGDLTGKGAGKGVMESAGASKMTELMTMMKGLDPKTMLAGGAAMVLVAGSIWILSKAMQEFSTGVSWDGVTKGMVAMLGLVGAMALVGGLVMYTGPLIMAGALAFLAMGSAMWLLGDAMQKISSSADGFSSIMGTLMSADIVKLVGLAAAFTSLGYGMMAFSGGALAMAATSKFLNTLGIGGESGGSKKDKLDIVIEKLDMLNETLKNKEFAANLDGRKVSKGLGKAIEYGT